ncbi:C40 family peptidase [Ralstonia solanacearum]|uniref:C40 family peptidase n=1 Tax=Ralstonia solanacearum TaxID=305 RepID=UPI001F155B82|nr:Mov34/MPN/PAD-1 family protein [Ralstonia solanacearum]
MISNANRALIERHALDEYPHECCGVIAGGLYVPCRNVAAKPSQDFELCPEDYAEAEDHGPVTVVVHSHPGASAQPSQADLTACEASGLPWVIVSLGAQVDGTVAVEDWYEFGPSGYSAPLIGCEFSHGTNDCYGLIQRYYWQTHGIALPDFHRPSNWWDDGHSDLYREGFPQAGFAALPTDTAPQSGDVLLMQIRSRNNVPNHAAVYLGDGWILHHCYGQLSRRDLLARYQPYVTHSLRHKEADHWIKSEQSASTES